MINNKKHEISSKQLMIFIISSQTGLGIVSLPSTLAGEVGHDGWISILLSGILSIFAVYIILSLLKRYSDKSIFQINILLYGRILGAFLNLALFVYLCATAGITSRMINEIIKITVLRSTPPLALSALLLIPTAYVCLKGFKVLSRLCSLAYISYFTILIFFLISSGKAKLSFIEPIGLAGIPKIMKGMFFTSFSYLGFELSTIVYPHIIDKNEATKYAVLANIFTTLFFTIIVFLLTILAGEKLLEHSTFPLFNIATSLRVPVIERADLFIIMAWFPLMGNVGRAYFTSSYHFIRLIFKVDAEIKPLLLFCILIIVLGRIPKDLTDVGKFMNTIGIVGVGIILYLIFSFLFSFINKKGVVTK